MTESDNKIAELAEMVRAIRERVRANYPTEGAGGLQLPNLMPVVHARDAAEGKVAAIGTVNPRPAGVANDLAQAGKRMVARALDWHVREQVEFNRAILSTIDAIVEAQSETNRALAALGSRLAALEEPAGAIKEISSQWAAWRNEWQQKLNANEVKMLRGIAELQQAAQQRSSQIESEWRASMADSRRGVESSLEAARSQIEAAIAGQHADFTKALERTAQEIQERLWKDMERVHFDTQAAVHRELRLLRQRSGAPVSANSPTPVRDMTPSIDWDLFAEKFRGQPESIREGFERYTGHFAGRSNVLDLGCGRGEFLEIMRRDGVSAKGVDLSASSVAACHEKGLNSEQADMFSYLEEQPDGSLGGIFCAQVIEHLAPFDVPRLVSLCARKLARGAPVVFETPNPECLAIFASHFYIDPTHVRPVPPALMAFYLEEAGFIEISVLRFAMAEDTWPFLKELPNGVREQFFGALDYAISARNAS